MCGGLYPKAENIENLGLAVLERAVWDKHCSAPKLQTLRKLAMKPGPFTQSGSCSVSSALLDLI